MRTQVSVRARQAIPDYRARWETSIRWDTGFPEVFSRARRRVRPRGVSPSGTTSSTSHMKRSVRSFSSAAHRLRSGRRPMPGAMEMEEYRDVDVPSTIYGDEPPPLRRRKSET